ncbi:MAG: hypothetical protein JO020_25400 [Chloroflexi bacterium]|nr:hypothetical protein [Chloroflexota bacterium]
MFCAFESESARGASAQSGLAMPEAAETLALVPLPDGSLVAAGRDIRGLVYATLELADRVKTAVGDPLDALRPIAPIVQQPANPIRGIARLFVSDVEDLPWFTDRDFWRAYLTELMTQRFNRIHLAFGIGHDFLRNVIDAYFLFAYPFLVDVPGYHVRARGLSEVDRERNLEMLRFASDEAAARGLHFQLGIWTQAYEWVDSPRANYVIDGLTPENHAVYCRDAVCAVLQACPSIAGVTFRVHGESGVPEGNYDFWREVFRGVSSCGRRVELDLHPKGVGPEMIDVGLETGLPVTLSPKFTAEHMGLPGHQVAIRELERSGDRNRESDAFVAQLMNQSGADLRYTRYGNADFLREDRRYGLFYRMWPGTQRLLLWGDAALAAGYGRSGSFGGALGIEFCEPLSFKGRRGSGLPGGREAYADDLLRADGGADWQKFRFTYRMLGRLLYDPDEDRAVLRRAFAAEFGAAAAEPVEVALSNASRILPLVTSAYHPSAANNRYWPEMYTNLPIVSEQRSHPYRDTPTPRRFGTASPLDPGLFLGVQEFVHEVTQDRRSGRISPVRVARTLDGLTENAARALDAARGSVADRNAAGFRRFEIDVSILTGLGTFFAAKLRAGVAYALWQATNDLARLRQALEQYHAARAAWLRVIEHGRAYRTDVTVGGEPWLRGNWSDRLDAIDADLADMQAVWDQAQGTPDVPAASPLDDLDPARHSLAIYHVPSTRIMRGEPLEVALVLGSGMDQIEAMVHYRHVNQAESYRVEPLRRISPECLGTTIPADYTDSPFPLQYFFVAHRGAETWHLPDLDADLANQPYWLTRTVHQP